mmetsp:Transcript_13136/g.37790  ORF Transcript_13136/g.37790 Transcript_13136/m.37790 type:complete len:351 (-) Transcript_13136:136-1188(-)
MGADAAGAARTGEDGGGAAALRRFSWLGETVVVPRPEELEARLERFRGAGVGSLQLIMDFDHTLTAFKLPDGRKCPQCHDIVKRSPMMPERFLRDYATLGTEMSRQLKLGQADFEAWWRQAHTLIKSNGMRREWIPEMLRHSEVRCRRGIRELFGSLQSHGVPVLIVSAGITDLIQETLAREGIATTPSSSSSGQPGLPRILANDFHFDEATGVLSSFTEPPMHQHAKASTGHREAEYFKRIGRRNVILLGDSPHDCDPLVDIAGVEEAIRIGFYNKDRPDTSRARYEEVYDVLLSNERMEGAEDLDLLPVLELLRSVGVARPQEQAQAPPEKRRRQEPAEARAQAMLVH